MTNNIEFKLHQKIKWSTIINGKVTTLLGSVVDQGKNQSEFGFKAQGTCEVTGISYSEILLPWDKSIQKL